MTDVQAKDVDHELRSEAEKSVDAADDDDDEAQERTSKPKEKGVKCFSLLSFGDEAEEEEEEINQVIQTFKGRGKSSHDLLDDPKLSAIPAVEQKWGDEEGDGKEDEENRASRRKKRLDKIKKKLKKGEVDEKKEPVIAKEDEDVYLDERDLKAKQQQDKLSAVKDEFKQLKKQMLLEMRKKEQKQEEEKVHSNPAVEEFINESKQYREASNKLHKKGVSREEQALELLAKFKNRLHSTREKLCSQSECEEKPHGEREEYWLCHELRCQKEEEGPVLAKDANMRGEGEWYDLYDPRNPINKRRAGLAGGEEKKMRSN